jgi:4a-hydroxytetrahydrobiopterin dehydratase
MSESRPEWVSPEQFASLDGLDDWRYILGAIQTELACESFAQAARLVGEISAVADDLDHHPDLHLRYPGIIEVVLTTHAEQAVTSLDVDLARRISDMAAADRLGTNATSGQVAEVAIDTLDADAIRPFWAAVLGYDDVDGVLVDPARRGPGFWFQKTDEARRGRGRLHIDVSVAHDVAEQRVADALAAGGRLVTDEFARAWWVLADAEGNEVCLCTWQDRS